MQKKPLIGLNLDFKSKTHDTAAYYFLSAGYIDCIIRAGGIPVMIPIMEDEDDISATLDQLDGFILVGGLDLDPHRDGFMRHTSCRIMSPQREAFDRILCRQICERRLNVFGIGVGMQLLNLTMGGNLHLHIPEALPNAVPHRDKLDPSHRHGLDIEPGSLLERIYGDGEIRVNSNHHMAVDEVAPEFTVTARCPDGVIEAIESTADDWIAIGTQFHPEAPSATAMDFRIIEEFIEDVKIIAAGGSRLQAA
ncbi:MAG: gamma-glutamyl-gamma-aminobutyrate hydrolase family protein [Planctomycetota bacterium]|nr:gamma-glutamyl-gamma-aminobutyrate hydrolase family protein [Planctomycetota bacterium]